MKNLFEELSEFYKTHKWRVNGAVLGAVFALLILKFGLIKSIFIALCIFIGYYIGKKFESDKKIFKRILDKLLPPGRYR